MDLLTLITRILAAGSLLALIWLVVRAFGKSAGWGLGVLLLSPVSAALFGLKYWDSEKKAFLLYLGTTCTSVGLALYLFSTWGGWELLRTSSQVRQGIETQQLSVLDAETFLKASTYFRDRSGMDFSDPRLLASAREILDRQAARQAPGQEATPQPEAGTPEAKDNPHATPMNRKTTSVPVEHTRLVFRTIPVEDAHKYIGATAKVTRRNAEEKEYRLTGVTSKSLQFTQRNNSGIFSFALRMNDIVKLRILVKVPN
jgi:hypothetical protein